MRLFARFRKVLAPYSLTRACILRKRNSTFSGIPVVHFSRSSGLYLVVRRCIFGVQSRSALSCSLATNNNKRKKKTRKSMKPLKHLHFPSRAYYNNNMYIYVFLRTTARGAREVLLSVIFFFL